VCVIVQAVIPVRESDDRINTLMLFTSTHPTRMIFPIRIRNYTMCMCVCMYIYIYMIVQAVIPVREIDDRNNALMLFTSTHTTKMIFPIRIRNSTICVCVCVREREREREGGVGKSDLT